MFCFCTVEVHLCRSEPSSAAPNSPEERDDLKKMVTENSGRKLLYKI